MRTTRAAGVGSGSPAWTGRDIALAGLFAALTAVGAQIQVPLPFSPVPVVLSNFFAILAGLTLGARLGVMSQAAYVLAGAVGLPVFAGLRGGVAVLIGPTGGYLAGFVLAAGVAGLLRGMPPSSTRRATWAAAAAAAAIYVPGVLWLSGVTGADVHKVALMGVLPFLPGDALKAVAGGLIAPSLSRAATSRAGRVPS
ncbi:MAG TPA: biotin transporter BioY [bacterium]|nr:biotin transporter BioY [bacterium]